MEPKIIQETMQAIAAVREARVRQPFEPFIIRLIDGRCLEVRQPQFIAVGRNRIVVIADDEVESWTAIEPRQIVSLKSIPRGSDEFSPA